MIGKAQKRIASAAAAALAVLVGASGAGAVCVGDCNSDHQVLVNEVVASVNIFQETSALSTCVNADQNGDLKVFINEVVGAVNSFLGDESTCQMVSGPTPTQTSQGPTATRTATSTNTAPVATSTPTRSATRTATQTPSPTPTLAPSGMICGNQVVDSGEECDNGGTCIGGSNAGTACTSEGQCQGDGVCFGGTRQLIACATDAECPGSQCIHCVPQGGDGCAANCTNETVITGDLVPGVVMGGAGGPMIKAGTSGAFVHSGGILQLPLALTGQQRYIVGKLRNGQIPAVSKAGGMLPPIRVSTLACACVRSIGLKTCGGVLLERDNSSATSCTPDYTVGESLCAGKKPCTFVHGSGNASTGVIGCNGLDAIDLSFTQDAGGQINPPAPTPLIGAGPAILTLSGNGGPGSGRVINSTAIGQIQPPTTAPNPVNACNVTNRPVGDRGGYGPDGLFCNLVGGVDDDPQAFRGTPQTLPALTGSATGVITNYNDGNVIKSIGPFTVTGVPFNCTALLAPTPSVTGAGVAGAFGALNQPTVGSIIVTNVQYFK